ncbi:beta strand repeat-containing protein, partial [Pontixanthobacter gangjinensis]
MEFDDQQQFGSQVDDTPGSLASLSTDLGQSASRVILRADASNTITLPNGVAIETIQSDGRDLIIEAVDGTVYVIIDGAIGVPQIIVDGVAVPPLNLAALIVGNEPEPAAGPPQSSGGNFATDVGPIQDAFDLGDLLPYTELAFPQPEEEEVIPAVEDEEPTVVVITPDNPVGATNASAEVDEAGLPARAGEPAGTEAASDSETTAGTIKFESPDGTDAVLINGVEITAIGQTFTSPDGTLTITSISEGSIGFSYRLDDNLLGVTEDGFFSITVRDTDGDEATASLIINVLDDAPITLDDTDFVAAGTFGPETGNVITGIGTTSGVAGADNLGADGGSVTSVVSGSGNPVDVSGGEVTVAGMYGTLTINADGSYSYVRDAGTPGGVTETFGYTVTDGDGSTSTSALTIEIGDAPVQIVSVPESGAGTIVNEAGLPERPNEAPGTAEATPVESTSGTITFSAPDGVASVEINGVVITGAGQVIVTPEGTLTIDDYDPDGGTLDYTFELTDNTSGDDTTVSFEVTVTDTDGDSDTDDFTITVVDDVPEAIDDTAVQSEEDASITVDAFANDIPGADSIQLDQIALVPGSTIGGGSVVYNGDGTFTYNPAPGEEGEVAFDYTITDGDGDVSTATVSITLAADSTPAIALQGGNVVEEAGLPARPGEPAGSDAASNSEIATGSISISTAGDTVASLTVNGVNVTNGGTVTTANGSLTVILNAGAYTYSYTLSDNTLADPGSDSFSLIVTDSDGDSASTTLTIDIIDDVPTANADTNSVTEGAIVGGNVLTDSADVFGADGAEAAGGVVGVRASGGDTTTDASGNVGSVINGLYGTLTLGADGTYSYASRGDAITADAVDVFVYTIEDGDGDLSTTTLTIDVSDVTLSPDNDTQVVNEAALDAVGSTPGSNAETASGQLTVAGTGTVTYVLDSGSDTYGTLTLNADGSYSYTLTSAFDTSPDADNGTNTELGAESYGYTATDASGNSVTGTITIDIIDDVP